MREAPTRRRGEKEDDCKGFSCWTCVLAGSRSCADGSRRSPALIRGKVVEGILCRQAIAVAMANLLEDDRPLFVENERRRIRRLMRRVPTQTIQIRDLIVRIRHENNIRWQLGLLFEEFLRMLIQISGRSRINQQHSRVLRLEVGSMIYEIMNL